VQRSLRLWRADTTSDQDGVVPKSPEDKAEKRAERNAAPADANGARGAWGWGTPEVVAPSHKVTVAFPFSQIRFEEPTRELAELSSLVLDLIAAMAEWVPEDRLEELRARAQAVRDRLR
jgi:hypothetical protein